MPVTARAHSPVFYLPGTRRNGKPTRKELENPNPPEFRHGTNRVTENEILKLSFQRQGKTYEATSLKGKYDDNEKWINRLFNENYRVRMIRKNCSAERPQQWGLFVICHLTRQFYLFKIRDCGKKRRKKGLLQQSERT